MKKLTSLKCLLESEQQDSSLDLYDSVYDPFKFVQSLLERAFGYVERVPKVIYLSLNQFKLADFDFDMPLFIRSQNETIIQAASKSDLMDLFNQA